MAHDLTYFAYAVEIAETVLCVAGSGAGTGSGWARILLLFGLKEFDDVFQDVCFLHAHVVILKKSEQNINIYINLII